MPVDYGKIGGAAGDLVSAYGSYVTAQGQVASLNSQASGSWAAAMGFDKAADLEHFNEQYAGAIGKIQEAQQLRKNYQAESGTVADWAGAGFAGGGSGGDILRSNRQQGALAEQVIGMQTELNVNNYAIQEDSYRMQAQKERDAATGDSAAAGAAAGGSQMQMIGSGIAMAATIAAVAF